MSYYCLITNDGMKKSGYEKFLKRIKSLYWPIYLRTENKKYIKENDNLIFYIAGKGELRQHFVGSAKIANLHKFYDYKNVLTSVDIDLGETKIFKKPVFLKEISEQLNFIKHKKNLGLNLQGGCKLMSEDDYNLIINNSLNKKN